MRVYIFILLLFTFIPTSFAQTSEPVTAQDSVFICPMHPHISGEDGDTCPICGMSLVLKDVEPLDDSDGLENAFKIQPSYVQELGVKTSKVANHVFGKSIRAFGKISPSTRLEYAVDVRTSGWIVDLNTDAIGDTVKEGDLLFTYYSPQLMETQSDFLRGRLLGNPEQRLRFFGMGKKAIAEIKKNGKFLKETPFYAPHDGTVTILNVRKGAHIESGGSVMSIQDFSKVWVNVDVPTRDVQFLEVGTPAKVIVPEIGAEYQTIIDFIHPINNPKNRTAKVRMVIDNLDGELRPDTYIDAVFNAKSKSRLSVPQEAILRSGMGSYVFENLNDGYFRSIMVKEGITSDGFTHIISGLSIGQDIVTSGQFMLDAESNLRGGMSSMGGMPDMDSTTEPMKAMEGHQHAH